MQGREIWSDIHAPTIAISAQPSALCLDTTSLLDVAVYVKL